MASSPAGTHNLTARATDNQGLTGLSAARSVTVNTANTPPTVNLTAPANNSTYVLPADIVLSATAKDAEINGSVRSAPRYIRSDNGPECVSAALMKWAVEQRIETAFINPGKPWQNGTNESFNGKFRDECLAMEWFRNRIEAKIVIEDWRTHYNEVRPHSSLQYATPAEFRRSCEIGSTTGAMNL